MNHCKNSVEVSRSTCKRYTMATFFSFISCYLLMRLTTSQSHTCISYYVGANGIDIMSCGMTASDPCGTLYKASELIQLSSTNVSTSFCINVLDGQNQNEITKYHTSNSVSSNGYNPCLPMLFNATLDIVITFNPQTIHDLNDWYPRTVCESIMDKHYLNEYMFDGGKSLQINNLIINNYGTHHFYPFIRSIAEHNASITCNKCTFESIVCIVNDSKPLIHTLSSVRFINSSFVNINVSSVSSDAVPSLIYGDHFYLSKDVKRSFVFVNTVFINISSVYSIVDTVVAGIRYADRPCTITMNKCTFKNICVETSIIHDQAKLAELNMNDTVIDNIICGSIYYSASSVASKVVRIDTMSVTSISQLNTVNENALFHFHGSDVVVFMNAITIHYTYNTTQSCSFVSTVSNSVLNLTCDVMECANPVTAIDLIGEMHLSNVQIDIDAYKHDRYTNCTVFKYEEGGDFIINTGHMEIHNMSIGRTICETFLYSSNILSVHNLSFNKLNRSNYTPNDLHSKTIIGTVGTYSSLTVSNSHFIGSWKAVKSQGGTGSIYDTTFEYTGNAFHISACHTFTVARCRMSHIGIFNTYVQSDEYLKEYATPSLTIWDSSDITIINNTLSAFNDDGLLLVRYAGNVTLMRNTFNVDTTGLFDDYYVAPEHLIFGRSRAPVVIRYSSNIRVMHNIFDRNEVDPDNMWLRFSVNPVKSVNCLSNNTFTNTAIYAWKTNITSCFRPQLIHDMYNGPIDASLLGQMNHFVIDVRIPIRFLFKFGRSKVALDQVNITFINNNDTNQSMTYEGIPVLLRDAEMLMVDSFLADHDILHKHTLCSVVHNDRLSNNTFAISRLHIHCGDNGWALDSGWNKSMDSNRTQLVNHLHATKINFTPKSLWYYPGGLLQFEYTISDMLNNEIDYDANGLLIRLHSNAFFTDINLKYVDTTGILLTDVSIADNIGDEYAIFVEVLQGLFVAEYTMITLHIIGCPMGFGPDANNFTCIACNTDSYNLINGNVEQCISCAPESNADVKCMDGTILVSENHWVGFDDDHNIISSICPPSYCCTNRNKCDYANKDELCAANRDYNSPLCSKCITGYSESMNGTTCVKCKTSYNFVYLLLAFAVSLAGSLLVLRSDKIRHDLEDMNGNPLDNALQLRGGYLKLMIKIMAFKCFLYYEQAISEIVTSAGPLHLVPSLINLSIITTLQDMCFVSGSTAKQKILMDLMIPIMIVMILCSYYVVYIFNKRAAIIIRGRVLNFGKTFLTLFALMVGKVLDVLCKLLSCKTVGNRSVHFYFADEECFGATWIASLICLMLVICSFSALFIQARRMSVAERQNPKYALFIYTSRYKPQYYYWEFVLFVRRILVSLFAAFAHRITLKLVFIIVIAYCAVIQHLHSPFMIHEANHMELMLLQCLVLVIVIELPYAQAEAHTLITIALSFFIVVPIPLMMYYICKVMHRKRWKHSKAHDQEEVPDESVNGDEEEQEEDVIEVVNGTINNNHRQLWLSMAAHAGSFSLHNRKEMELREGVEVELNKIGTLEEDKCTDCREIKCGKRYEITNLFYCWDCWKKYEGA
eukprot:277138_1